MLSAVRPTATQPAFCEHVAELGVGPGVVTRGAGVGTGEGPGVVTRGAGVVTRGAGVVQFPGATVVVQFAGATVVGTSVVVVVRWVKF